LLTDAPDRRPTVAFLTANQTLPFDRRVWQECRSMKRRGFRVIGISPMGVAGRGLEPFENVEGIDIHRYPLEFATSGVRSYGREFSAAVWRTGQLLRRVGRSSPIDVVHGANPPDFLLFAALGLGRQRPRLVFDHHDLSPELYLARTGRRDVAYRVLKGLERLSFSAASVVISTNESFRRIAIERGGKRPEDVFVVRNGPDLSRFRRTEPDPSLKRGKPYLLAYAGVMGQQDGVDHAVRALAVLQRWRRDWHAILMGDGEVLPDMRKLAAQLGLGDAIEFTGWVTSEEVMRVISTSDVCLNPDPKNEANDLFTMIKVMDYMALSRPVVSYDLAESRVSAGTAARYASANDVEDFAGQIAQLLDDPDARASMGEAGRAKVERELAWQHSERALYAAYDRLLAK
jgi:glycosyltransferase involved in cell wall biosynthesis